MFWPLHNACKVECHCSCCIRKQPFNAIVKWVMIKYSHTSVSQVSVHGVFIAPLLPQQLVLAVRLNEFWMPLNCWLYMELLLHIPDNYFELQYVFNSSNWSKHDIFDIFTMDLCIWCVAFSSINVILGHNIAHRYQIHTLVIASSVNHDVHMWWFDSVQWLASYLNMIL